MTEYIERAAAMESIIGLTIVDPAVAQYANAVCYNLQSLPAADVAPVVHGKWENKKGSPVSCYWTKDMKYLMVQEEAHCSVCGEYLNASAEYTVEGTFCPHCGAKMDQRG